MKFRLRDAFAIVLTLLLPAYHHGTSEAASPLAVHVQNNHLVDANGNVLRLLGVNRSGSEYACQQGWGIFDGPVDDAAIAAIKAWHVNAVRVPLNEDCWLGINLPNNQYIGKAYHDAIVAFVQRLNNAGLYVILDLHWNAPGTNIANQQQKMADVDHGPAFWSSVAATFKEFPGVIFDLYNEPHDITWDCWKNGCTVTDANGTWSTAGMTQLVAAVRAAGATQPIMLGGLEYAHDLSQWLAYKPVDPVAGPAQLVASYHSYCGPPGTNTVAACQAALKDAESKWPVVSALSRSVPVVTGEFGEYDCATTYVTPFMAFADANGISYLGWAWNTANCGSGPALITDYTGTPTAYGMGLKTHLASLTLSALTPFSAFSAQLTVYPNQPGFLINSNFTLEETSNGINPPAEPMRLQIGNFTTTIPPGSFGPVGVPGYYSFVGVINGVNLRVLIRLTSGNNYIFVVIARNVSLTIVNAVTITLTIGDDSGATTVSAVIINTG